jgi:hypothetical protein
LRWNRVRTLIAHANPLTFRKKGATMKGKKT